MISHDVSNGDISMAYDWVLKRIMVFVTIVHEGKYKCINTDGYLTTHTFVFDHHLNILAQSRFIKLLGDYNDTRKTI